MLGKNGLAKVSHYPAHLKLVLNSAQDSEMLWQTAEEFVRAEVLVEVVEGIHLGRMTALRKPTGRVRGIVVGDTF